MLRRITTLAVATTAVALAGCSKPNDAVNEAAKNDAAAGVPAPSIEEVKAIAEEAYIYGFPMIAAYKAMYEFNVDTTSPQYKTGFNQIWNDSKTFTPKETLIYLHGLRQEPTPSEFDDAAADTDRV